MPTQELFPTENIITATVLHQPSGAYVERTKVIDEDYNSLGGGGGADEPKVGSHEINTWWKQVENKIHVVIDTALADIKPENVTEEKLHALLAGYLENADDFKITINRQTKTGFKYLKVTDANEKLRVIKGFTYTGDTQLEILDTTLEPQREIIDQELTLTLLEICQLSEMNYPERDYKLTPDVKQKFASRNLSWTNPGDQLEATQIHSKRQGTFEEEMEIVKKF